MQFDDEPNSSLHLTTKGDLQQSLFAILILKHTMKSSLNHCMSN